jgi:hypothetical protein
LAASIPQLKGHPMRMKPPFRLATMAFAAALAGTCLIGGSLIYPQAAQAEVIYPWCIVYGGGGGSDGGSNCGFVSRQQCLATASPGIGHCYANPMYPDTPPPRQRAKRRAQPAS